MPRRVANRIERLNEFPTYKGGDTCLVQGYVFEYAPRHPLANGWGWVGQHRLVGEDLVGRPLRRSKNPAIAECVHHKDECRSNNSPENLEVMTVAAHRSYHSRQNGARNQLHLTDQSVAGALHGRTIAEAAEHLRVHKQTLRNRFPHLLAPRQRSTPHRIDADQTAHAIRPYASDCRYSLRDAAQALNMSPITIVRACKHHGIAWVHKTRPGRPRKSNPAP